MISLFNTFPILHHFVENFPAFLANNLRKPLDLLILIFLALPYPQDFMKINIFHHLKPSMALFQNSLLKDHLRLQDEQQVGKSI